MSDRAKALIKLSHPGLGCPSLPELFHLGHDRAHERLTTLGTEVLYMVSDRAQALIKLADTGLGCLGPSLAGGGQ